MSTQFSDLEKRMTSVASVATKFGDRLQVILQLLKSALV